MAIIKLKPPSETELRFFAVLQIVFFAIVLFVLWQHSSLRVIFQFLFACSVPIGIVGLLKPALIRPIHRFWMMLVLPIGWAISHTLMALVYYLVVTPIGIWRRNRYGDPLKRELDSSAITYWDDRKQKRKIESYFRQF